MNVYVLGYRTKDLEPGATPLENIEIDYSDTPEWRMPFAELAELERASLEKMRVHVGEHYCEFAVEALPEGEFAIVCTSHPAHLKAATTRA